MNNKINFQNKIVLITGGAGFIGHHLSRSILKYQPKQLIVVDNLSTGKRGNLNDLSEFENFYLIEKDILKLASEDLPNEIDYIFHLAALVSVPLSFEKSELTHQINESGFVRILELAKQKNTKKVVYASSSAVYGEVDRLPITEDFPLQPQSPYAVSKQLNEIYARSYYKFYGIQSIGFRFFNVYGDGQDPSSPYSGVISLFTDKMKNSDSISIFGDGDQIRDFVHVSDVVNALIRGAISTMRNDVFNVGSGNPISINELFSILKEIYAYEKQAKYLEKRKGDIQKSLSSISKIQNELGYEPSIDLFSGLKKLAESLK